MYPAKVKLTAEAVHPSSHDSQCESELAVKLRGFAGVHCGGGLRLLHFDLRGTSEKSIQPLRNRSFVLPFFTHVLLSFELSLQSRDISAIISSMLKLFVLAGTVLAQC